MTISDVAVGDAVQASKQNEIIEGVNLSGMVGIVPGSVAGTGVTVDTDSGLVTFTAATSITLDGVFSATYRNYRVFIESNGTAANINCVLRTSAPADVVTAYDRTELLARNATVTSATTLNQTSWIVNGIVNTLIQGDMDLSAPFLSVPTTAHSRFGIHGNPAASSTANGIAINYLTHRTSASYAGLKFTYSAAQSGTVRVYGYN